MKGRQGRRRRQLKRLLFDLQGMRRVLHAAESRGTQIAISLLQLLKTPLDFNILHSTDRFVQSFPFNNVSFNFIILYYTILLYYM